MVTYKGSLFEDEKKMKTEKQIQERLDGLEGAGYFTNLSLEQESWIAALKWVLSEE